MTAIKTRNYPNAGQSFGIAGIMILSMIVLIPVNLILNKFIDQEASMFIYYLLAVGIPFWIVNSIRNRNSDSKTFNLAIENKRIIPLILISTIALLFGIITPISSLIPVPDVVKKALIDVAGQNGLFSFLTMVIAAPILEELIFRGIILDGLLNKYSPLKSILISSLLFGLVHLNPWQFITGFMIGIFAGWIYYKTRSLSLTIIIHASANLSGFLFKIMADIDSSSMDETLVESYGGLFNLFLTIVGSIVAVGFCIYYLRKEFEKKIPNGGTQQQR